MPYTGGTPAAQACIKQLTELGALVDVYSKQWLDAHPNFPYCSADDLTEYQATSSNACEGHLLVISTSLDESVVGEQLIGSHPAFKAVFGEDAPHHKPDFVFMNLATQQILCVGLGRRNQLFGYAIGAEEVEIDDGNVQDVTSTDQIETAGTPTLQFMRQFVQYDYAGIVTRLIDSLYEFGVSARAWDHLPLNPELIEEILDQGPDEEGLFDIDDELMTLEEARSVIAEFESADDWGKENLSTLQDLFPELTWGDVSTGDY
ncbi:MAG: hypothetical protein ACKO0Z_26330 [Betaproteobacteria bacterium]